jgi:nitrate reductase gamma subunit
MSFLSIAYAVLFYIATAVLLIGLAAKIRSYIATPAPLKIPTTPAPTTTTGVALRLTREVVFFESLFKSSKWTWLFGWLFHAALLLVLLRQCATSGAGVDAVSSCVLRHLRRLRDGGRAGRAVGAAFPVDRVRYISTPSDHLHLALLLAIGLTGLGMRFVAHTDIVALKAFMLGLLRFDLQPLPADPVLLVHLALVALLMLVFPISKLLHAPGLFFSPTRNQADTSREVRHVTAWATALPKK